MWRRYSGTSNEKPDCKEIYYCRGCWSYHRNVATTGPQEYPQIVTENLPEAEVFSCYLKEVYQLEADALETRSSNCGNNITNLIALLEEKNITWKSIILCQDATMQHRMEAGLHKYASENLLSIMHLIKRKFAIRKLNCSIRFKYMECGKLTDT